MKSTQVMIAGITGISYEQPETLAELATLTKKEDESAAFAQILHAACQHYLQGNLIKVRKAAAKLVAEAFDATPKFFIGKTEVIKGEDENGVVAYKTLNNKVRKLKKGETVKAEADTDFLKRVAEENNLELDAFRPQVQQAASETPFDCEVKRTRGSVKSKPVGAKWIKLAEKIVNAGNAEAAATKLAGEINKPVDVSGEDAVKMLALGLSEKARQEKLAAEKEWEDMAGTEDNPLVVNEA